MAWREKLVAEDGFTTGSVHVSGGSRTNHSLNSAFVRGVSGAAVGIRYRCLTNQPINELYVFNDLTTGTRANVSLLARVYDVAASGTQAGTTLLATSNAATLPAADDRWIRFVFPTPYTPAAGEWVWLNVENTAAAPATDFCGIMNASAANNPRTTFSPTAFTTTNGWSTAGTSNIELPNVILQGSATVAGMPWTLLSTVGTFVGKRGVLLSSDLKRFQYNWFRQWVNSNTWTNLQVYDLATPPTGTPLIDLSIPSSGLDRFLGLTDVSSLNFSTLPGSGPFVLCTVFSATQNQGGMLQIEDYASFPTLFDRFTEDNFLNPAYVFESAGNWVIDRSRTGGMMLAANDVVSSGGGLFLPRSFDGGLAG